MSNVVSVGDRPLDGSRDSVIPSGRAGEQKTWPVAEMSGCGSESFDEGHHVLSRFDGAEKSDPLVNGDTSGKRGNLGSSRCVKRFAIHTVIRNRDAVGSCARHALEFLTRGGGGHDDLEARPRGSANPETEEGSLHARVTVGLGPKGEVVNGDDPATAGEQGKGVVR